MEDTVIIELPRPVRTAQHGEKYYFVAGGKVSSLIFDERSHLERMMLNLGLLFSTKSRAEKWVGLKERALRG
ncbi:hypothetical protein [Pasteurella sp. PK-2025]|uniref:hypothetical protein n=1 Tax=Pasteurella sp. PK-2025 TaxID=3413133 RepID=UPI003C73731D